MKQKFRLKETEDGEEREKEENREKSKKKDEQRQWKRKFSVRNGCDMNAHACNACARVCVCVCTQ